MIHDRRDTARSEPRLSPEARRLLDRLARTADPAVAQRLCELVLVLEEEIRRQAGAEMTAPDRPEAQALREERDGD